MVLLALPSTAEEWWIQLLTNFEIVLLNLRTGGGEMHYAIVALGVTGVVVGGIVASMIMIQAPIMKSIAVLVLPSIILGIGVILAGIKLKTK